MLEKLNAVYEKFNGIEEKLALPDTLSDMNEYKRLMRERKEILPVYEKFTEYKRVLQNIEDAKEILASNDADLKALAEEELSSSEKELLKIEEELKFLLIPKDANDDKSVIVEIRGGAGGEEAALFAASLYRMYSMYSDTKGFKTEIINVNETELGGYKEISFMILGEGAFSRLKFESGVHRVQRVPDTESGGRIHTSTVTVAVLPEAEEVDFEINPADLQIDTYRSSGAGGQHVNKTESAIRITHIPTGTVVECQEERSQHKNREKALRVLRSKICERMQAEEDAKIAETRKTQVGTGDRSERIRTYNFPQSRVTDHRIGLTLYKLESFLNGNIDEMVDALITAERISKLKEEA